MHPTEGRVTVIEGGPILQRAGWRPSVGAATELLRAISAHAVYAFVRRAFDLTTVEFANPLPTDRLRASSPEARAHEERLTPERSRSKVLALPKPPYVGHWDVALVLRDGRVIEDVELGFAGAIVTSIAGGREFALDPDDIVDVLDRSTRRPSAIPK